MSTVFPEASRGEVVRRKLRGPRLAAENHGQPCCHRQGLKFPAAMAPESTAYCAESSEVTADFAVSAQVPVVPGPQNAQDKFGMIRKSAKAVNSTAKMTFFITSSSKSSALNRS